MSKPISVTVLVVIAAVIVHHRPCEAKPVADRANDGSKADPGVREGDPATPRNNEEQPKQEPKESSGSIRDNQDDEPDRKEKKRSHRRRHRDDDEKSSG